MPTSEQTALRWKLRRIAAGLRQQDIARECGLPLTRYNLIERGLRAATEFEALHLLKKSYRNCPRGCCSSKQTARRGLDPTGCELGENELRLDLHEG